MTDRQEVARHYSQGNLLERLRLALETTGKSAAGVSVDDLAPADEFHIGGRTASEDFISQLGLTAQHHVLDVGCGIGGTSRFVADRYGCRVCGVDVTPEFIETGRVLCDWVGLGERVDLQHGSALDLPFDDGSFDAAIMLHVGMNIADKQALFAEVCRILRPGALFGVYDVMQTGAGPITYPVPWSSAPGTSALATPEDYSAALEQAGFTLLARRDRRDFALEFFTEARRRMEASGSAPVLGVHIAMGDNAPLKIANMIGNITAGLIAPVEIIARRSM
ncbi:MAG TPA: class I SAM-dependent methyltransferase [Gammaproteobacteria bacterium]|nr:class I SAM-dependent methyltransferase [Gammaproteobacteria bacterium]